MNAVFSAIKNRDAKEACKKARHHVVNARAAAKVYDKPTSTEVERSFGLGMSTNAFSTI